MLSLCRHIAIAIRLAMLGKLPCRVDQGLQPITSRHSAYVRAYDFNLGRWHQHGMDLGRSWVKYEKVDSNAAYD